MDLSTYLRNNGLNLQNGNVLLGDKQVTEDEQAAILQGYSNLAGGTSANAAGPSDILSSIMSYANKGLGTAGGFNANGSYTPSTGLGGALGALNAGMGLFNAYDQYKTNKLAREGMNIANEANRTKLADYNWNRDQLRGAFGLGK